MEVKLSVFFVINSVYINFHFFFSILKTLMLAMSFLFGTLLGHGSCIFAGR